MSQAHGHPSYVAEQFEDAEQQHESATLGMWTFLATEVLFFGGMFTAYTVYRLRWPDAFRQGSLDLKWYLGGINTGVLLFSSFMMAMAVHAAGRGDSRGIIRWLVATIVFAVIFLGIKGTEYYIEYQEQLVPWFDFSTERPSEADPKGIEKVTTAIEHATPFAPEDRSTTRPRQEELFMIFYFVMTAIHATHMIIGIGLMLVLIWMARRRMFTAEYHSPVEMIGLYWHFVDIVWVFLFPALYLLRNS